MRQTTPLMQLLWDKNTRNIPAQTPEQKALIEKNIMEEVSKIQDEKVRGYYVQEMQKRIYETYGRGSLRPQRSKSTFKKTSHIGPPIRDVDLRFILAGVLLFPDLINDFEERLLTFDISKFTLFNLLHAAIDMFHEDEDTDSATLMEKLKSNGYDKQLSGLWEIGMLKSQKPFVNDIKRQINTLLAAVQVKQLNQDINEYKLKLDKGSNSSIRTLTNISSNWTKTPPPMKTISATLP